MHNIVLAKGTTLNNRVDGTGHHQAELLIAENDCVNIIAKGVFGAPGPHDWELLPIT
jgi:hypothetical protein